ncbi:single-stranded DNA-binding protein [Paractinoplanes globisporus]|uniref:Single-stranded DNA-binding protein n=1 Tax=Paractinoplanes globisporus TaxID=113565 RepID=A0ABW6WCU7_9ACTN|nr:single-stranded DNA-binding protein [Actinoplanes globisporus]
MFETHMTIVGNVLTAPEWRKIPSTGAMVANFRVASTARRYDKEGGQWIDGRSLRLRVVAWRRLAENVASSITVGDPVIVSGRVYSRDWKDDNGNHRLMYELEAYAIGHDLTRGVARFYRAKGGQGDGQLEDAESDAVVAGEATVALTAEEVPIAYGDGVPNEPEPTFTEPEPAPKPDEPGPEEDEDLALEVERLVAEQQPPARRTRRTKREPVAA